MAKTESEYTLRGQIKRERRTGKVIFFLSCLIVVFLIIESLHAQNPPAMIRFLIIIPILLAIPTFVPRCPIRVQGISATMLWLSFIFAYGYMFRCVGQINDALIALLVVMALYLDVVVILVGYIYCVGMYIFTIIAFSDYIMNRAGGVDSLGDFILEVVVLSIAVLALIFIIRRIKKQQINLEQRNMNMANLLRVLEIKRDEAQAATKALELINDILDYSKIDAGRMELVNEVYNLEDLLLDISRLVKARLYGKEVEFMIEGGEKVPRSLFGDSLRIKQILLNLLGNAVKFTKEGYIKLVVNATPGKEEVVVLHFDVIDTGIGIRKEDAAKLFNEFTQVDNRKNRKIQGTGLGLAIAKNFSKMMHGDITLESEYGKGSTFHVVIDQKVVDEVYCDFNRLNVNFDAEETGEESESKAINEFTCPAAKILIVDDNKVNLKVAKGIIGSYGADITLCESGEEALGRMQDNEQYDILFIDHMMPGMDGVETVQRIRSLNSDYARTVPIIALTANASEADKELFIKSGMNDLLGKPIDTHSLARILRTFLPKRLQVETPGSSMGMKGVVSGVGAEDDAQRGAKKNSGFDEKDFTFPMQGIDYRYAYDIFSGDRNAYIEILKCIADEGKTKPEMIRNLLEEKDYGNYTIEVHALKSSFLSIGAMALSDHFREHEMNGKNGNKKAIRDDFEKLDNEYREMLKQLEDFLQTEEKELPSKKVAGSSISLREYKKTLEFIAKNIEFFEIDRASEEISSLLDCKLEEKAEKRLAEAKQHMDNFMYEEAKEDIMVLLSMAEAEG